eukprot:UN25009
MHSTSTKELENLGDGDSSESEENGTGSPVFPRTSLETMTRPRQSNFVSPAPLVLDMPRFEQFLRAGTSPKVSVPLIPEEKKTQPKLKRLPSEAGMGDMFESKMVVIREENFIEDSMDYYSINLWGKTDIVKKQNTEGREILT